MAGIMFGNGWCNYLLQCRVWENTIGILLGEYTSTRRRRVRQVACDIWAMLTGCFVIAVNAVNNVNVVNAIIEDNAGAGIVAVGGYRKNTQQSLERYFCGVQTSDRFACVNRGQSRRQHHRELWRAGHRRQQRVCAQHPEQLLRGQQRWNE